MAVEGSAPEEGSGLFSFDKFSSCPLLTDAIREGETIAKPMGANAKPGFHPVAAGLWVFIGALPGWVISAIAQSYKPRAKKLAGTKG